MSAEVAPYGHTQAGEAVQRITLRAGLTAEIITYGALIARLEALGRDGPANVVLGLPDLAAYEARNPSFGVTVGRYANRIARGRFTLDGHEYQLSRNEGDNTLHGGKRGFSKRVWQLLDADAASARLAYHSADGEEGFPGALTVEIGFRLDGTTIRIEYEARTEAPTVVNLTNHSYFNLAGEGSGSALGHLLRIDADQFLELDADSLPTGRILDVAGTPFDFRAPHALGARIRDSHPQIVHGLGYDSCFLLRGQGFREAAAVLEPGTGRSMTVWTDQPAVQLYSANKLTGALTGPSGRQYRAGDALCLETQHYPDSPNHPHFPDTTLRPGTTFRSATEYRFALG